VVQTDDRAASAPEPGVAAPDFELQATPEKSLGRQRSSERRERNTDVPREGLRHNCGYDPETLVAALHASRWSLAAKLRAWPSFP
jgi:hypothetical protein